MISIEKLRIHSADLGLDQETLPESGRIFLEAIGSYPILLTDTKFQDMKFNEKTPNQLLREPKDSSVIGISISNIPYLTPDFWKPKLMEIFKAYGDILGIGLHHVVDGGWFNNKGFVAYCKPKGGTYHLNSLELPQSIMGRIINMGDCNFSFANHLPANRSAKRQL
ncbi:hypothetical protein MAM1_0058d03691 [Mucor ambiguus]|uniref:Uncharacterized protein n=1 Tax=Mucor ambiguus TaxID=91626 RepID=A0A0C9M4M0_9FUNG|nr:hypothetical protein MAM1_0058d03691 [Mucor ambiguus]